MADPTIAPYESYLSTHAGGYLRNTQWSSPSTCTYCVGIPTGTGYPTCWKCGNVYSYESSTDLRGFVSYGWDGSQSAALFYRYKEAFPSDLHLRLIRFMLFLALRKHMQCAQTGGRSFTMWATVPSLRARGHPQVLNTIASQMLSFAQARMSAAAPVTGPRTFRPDNFRVDVNVVGAHVLLIDDTWTSGAHAESAAAALKRAGAARVTLLVLARWLDPSRGDTESFMKSELTADFTSDPCPFGPTCP